MSRDWDGLGPSPEEIAESDFEDFSDMDQQLRESRAECERLRKLEFSGRRSLASSGEMLVRADIALKEAVKSARELIAKPAYDNQLSDIAGCIDRVEKGGQFVWSALAVTTGHKDASR